MAFFRNNLGKLVSEGKIILDFNEAKLMEYDGMAVVSAVPYGSHLHLHTDNHVSISSLSFYKLDALHAIQPTASIIYC